MTRKSKKYQLLIITLLLCFLQVAGIDVYAQEPVTPVQKDSTIQSREAPKARARRHRDPAQVTDSLRKDSIKILHPERLQATDSLSAAKIQIADSLDAANKKELKKIEQPTPIVVKTDTVPLLYRTSTRSCLFLIRPKQHGSQSYSPVEDRFITVNTGNCLLYTEDLRVAHTPSAGTERCIKTIHRLIWTSWTAIRIPKATKICFLRTPSTMKSN